MDEDDPDDCSAVGHRGQGSDPDKWYQSSSIPSGILLEVDDLDLDGDRCFLELSVLNLIPCCYGFLFAALIFHHLAFLLSVHCTSAMKAITSCELKNFEIDLSCVLDPRPIVDFDSKNSSSSAAPPRFPTIWTFLLLFRPAVAFYLLDSYPSARIETASDICKLARACYTFVVSIAADSLSLFSLSSAHSSLSPQSSSPSSKLCSRRNKTTIST